jgi:hypothetical protein
MSEMFLLTEKKMEMTKNRRIATAATSSIVTSPARWNRAKYMVHCFFSIFNLHAFPPIV